jgi:hypothetical protein
MKRLGGEGMTLQKAILGEGVGAVLLNGGIGTQSSYANVGEYAKATGRVVPPPTVVRGNGLESLSGKIQGLSIQPPKKRKNNIKFEM